MNVVDSHVHLWARGGTADDDSVPPSVMGPLMDEAGVQHAVVVSPFGVYGYETSYALQVARDDPARFRAVVPVDPNMDGLDEFVQGWAADDATAGMRLLLISDQERRAVTRGDCDALFRSVAESGQPLCVVGRDLYNYVEYAATRFPTLTIAVDHLGMRQPADLVDCLPRLTALATHPNVLVKVSALPMLSQHPYPFADIWNVVTETVHAFGSERTMWGTDWTRSHDPAVFRDSVNSFAKDGPLSQVLSERELDDLMGATAERVFGSWTSTTPEAAR
ncbi:MAG: amidohydrolase family protein [Mycetocola sp.]